MDQAHITFAMVQWVVANVFMLGVTTLVWSAVRVEDLRLDPIIFGFLFLFLTTTFLMILGLTGYLNSSVIFAISLIGCASMVWAWVTGKLPGGPASTRAALARVRVYIAERRPQTRRQRLIALLFGMLIGAQVLRLAVHVWVFPPYVWDTLTYHLPNVAEWVQRGSLTMYDTPVRRSFWPANYELFQTWFVLFPRHDFLIDASSIPFYVLASACVYAIGRALGLTRNLSVFAALLYAYTPSIVMHSTTGNNDLPIAFAYLFIVALTLSWRVRRSRESVNYALLIGMSFCLALGTKPYIVFLLPGLALLIIWRILADKSHVRLGAA